jgi:hypothetical protein
VTASELAKSYLVKAAVRLEMLSFLFERAAWPDVVREAQELVELTLKGMLRQVGVDPPKWHDVGPILLEQKDRRISGRNSHGLPTCPNVCATRESSLYTGTSISSPRTNTAAQMQSVPLPRLAKCSMRPGRSSSPHLWTQDP